MNRIFQFCTWKAELRKAVSLLLIVALLTGLVPQSVYATGASDDAAANVMTYDGDGYEVTAEITASWGSYANVDFKIINKSLHKMSGWQLKIPNTFTWSNLWNAHSAGNEGSYYVIEGEEWNKDIGLFGQVSFGGTMFFSSGEVSLPDTCSVTDLKARTENDTSAEDGSDGEENDPDTGEEDAPGTDDLAATSKLPYEIPAELEGLNYALFCGDTDGVSVYSNETKIDGDVHTNGSFTYGGTKLSVTGTLNAAKSIQINTSSIEGARIIGSEKSNTAQIAMPDLCSVLKENVFTNEDEIEENIEINGDSFYGDGILYAKNNIVYNVGNASTTKDKSLLLCAENGNITLNGSTFEINGVLYAPNGCVTINANEVTLNGRIIAQKVCLNGTCFNICAGDHDFDKIREWIDESGEQETLEAELTAGGNLKQNRRVKLDLKNTGEVSFDDTLETKWSFIKVGDETAEEEEFLGIEESSSTDIHKELLFKEAGTYKVSVRLQQGESQLTIEKELVIEKDRAPEAGFVFAQDFFVRDENGTATIAAEDTSLSHDGDEIAQRTWQIIYDKNGDGVFDEEPETIEAEAETSAGLSYTTKKAGDYKLILSVQEHFDDTIEEFITGEDYLSDDTSDMAEQSCLIRVFNEAPEVSFEIEKAAKADIVFTAANAAEEYIDYAGGQVEKLAQDLEADGVDVKTAVVKYSTLTAKDSFAWKEYDHYSYKEDSDGGQVVKKHITVEDESIHISGYPKVPYKDFLFIEDENDNTKILQFDLERDKNDWHTIEGGGFLFNTEIDEENDIINGFCVLLCTTGVKVMQLDHVPLSEFRDGTGSHGTCIASVKVSNVLEKKQFRVQANKRTLAVWCNDEIILSDFVLPECTSYGYGPILWNASHDCPQISYFDFTNIKMTTMDENLDEVISEHPWRVGAQRYVIHLSEMEIPEMKTDASIANVVKLMQEKDICMFVLGNEKTEEGAAKLFNHTEKGMRLSCDALEESMQTVRAYICDDMANRSHRIGDFISVEDVLSYKVNYADKENDAIYQKEWTYTSIPLSSRDETLSDAGTAVYTEPMENLPETGAYTISLRMQDAPASSMENSVSGNTVFGNELAPSNPYGLWSEPYEYPQTLLVQSRPVAKVSVSAKKDSGNKYNCAFAVETESYDPDHVQEDGKGIIAESLMYKEINDDTWTQGTPQYSVPIGGVYLFKYQVQDKEKSFSYPAITVVDTGSLKEFEPYEDKTKPQLSVSASPAGISLGDTITISAFAKDENPLSYFKVYCAGKLVGQEQGIYTYTPTKTGTCQIQVMAGDIARNTISKVINVKVVDKDVNAPQIKIDSASVLPQEPTILTVSGNVCDDKAFKQYTVSYRGGVDEDYVQAYTSTEEVENGVIARIDIADLEDGTYELLIEATDEVGNQSYFSTYFTLATETLGGETRIWIDDIRLNREKAQIEIYGTLLQNDETETVSGNCIRTEDGLSVSMNSIACEDGLIGVIPTEGLTTGHYKVMFVVAAQDGTFTKERAEFTYTVSSTDTEQSDDVIVLPEKQPTTGEDSALTLELSGTEAEIGTDVVVRVRHTGSISENSIKAYADAKEIPLVNGKGTFTSNVAKQVNVSASALTENGEELTVSQNCCFISKNDKTPPVVSFKGADEEGNLNIVTKGPVDLIGTAWDDEKILNYRLTYRMDDWEEEVLLAEGCEEKTEELLATLDTTMLLNGVYEIKLTATDEGGNESSAVCTCTVEGNLKVGEMSIAFKDLVTKMPFGDLNVLRMYDSRNKSASDFGYGWSLGLSGMTIRQTKPIEKGYEQTRSGSGLSTTFYLQEKYAHDVVVSYGDGTTDRFSVQLSPSRQRWLAIDEVEVNFVCETNPNLKLELAEDNAALFGGDELEWVFGSSGRSTYILTMEDGTKVYISEEDGVTKTVDAIGNTMTYSEDGFLYEDGRGVRFDRDFEGRIVKISDDWGHERAYSYDADGNLSTYTDGAGNTVTYLYDDEHRLAQIIDPSKVAVARYEYDEAGRLIASIDADGNRIEYNHDIESRREIVTDRRGYETVYEYDENGNVISVTDPEGNTTKNTYDADGNVLTETDALGNTKTYAYDENNNITQVTDAAGNVSNTYYDSQNRVTSMKNMDGTELLLDYNDKGLLTVTEDTDGNVTEYEYDTYGNISGIADDLGEVASYTYNKNGNLIKSFDGEGNETRHTYDASGNRIRTVQYKTTADGGQAAVTTTYTYDDAGRVIRSNSSATGTTTTTYDASGNITATKDGMGRITTYSHTPTGEMDTITYYDGTCEKFTYDEEGNVLSQTDRLGNTVRNTYDKAGNLKTSVDALGNTTTYVYDAAYRVTKVITPTGAVTSYEYDCLGRNTKITTDQGTVTYEYDAYGNVLSMTDVAGNVTTYEYDNLGRKTAVILPDGSKQTTTYDARGNILTQTDAEGATTTYEYDNNNNLTSITNGEGETTSYLYSGAGELLSQTDANGNTTTYVYNAAGNVTKETRADGNYKKFTYNTDGDVTGVTDYDGTAASYLYKKYLLWQTKTDSHTVKYTYDDLGQLTAVSDTTGTIRYEYDSYGRIASRETATGEKISYGYDYFGRLNAIMTSQGTTRYSFDKYDRLTSVTDHAGNETTYTYDNVGNKASQTNPDGSVTKYTYDACNRLTSEVTKDKNGNLLADYAYAFNGNGQKIETREAVKSATQGMVATITTYTYDKANRLTGESKTVAREDGTSETLSTEYFYDSAGNRTKKVEDGVKTEYTYNELNQLQSETTEGKEPISYAYDTNGNLLCRGTTTEYETYTYTGENRLESVTITTKTGETKETYEYDAEGNRLSKTESKAVKTVDETTGEVTTTWKETDKTYFVIDTSGSYAQVIAELDADKEVMVLYTRGDGIVSREEVAEETAAETQEEQVSETDGSKFYFYLSDGHGDVRQLTDETGAVTDSYRYNSFGELEESQGETENPYLYTGEYYDEATGLYYLRARYMNPETGTFTSMDTYRGNAYDPASLHRYTYAQNNPQMYTDPSGHSVLGAFIQQKHNMLIMSAICGMVSSLLNEILGGPFTSTQAFAIGAATGLCMMGAYIGMTVIQVLTMLGTVLQMHFTAESAAELVATLAYGVTGNDPNFLYNLVLVVSVLIVDCAMLALCIKIEIYGPRGKVSIPTSVKRGAGVLDSANYAQKTYSNAFSAEGRKIYSSLVGEPINTIDDLVNAINAGKVKVTDLPIEYIVRDGNTLILNTRTSQALTRARVPRSQWNVVNRTGNDLFEELLTGQLFRNKLTSEGISAVRLGGGR